jgi:outer membrane protein assembly factor BamD
MSAFNYYMARKYTDAVSSAQRFVTIHPGNAEAPYAPYLIAMSYYQQIEDVTRDQGITQQASDAFGELIRRYPQSRYAADARLKLDLIRDHLAGKEMEVGRFYQRSGNWLAASLRFREVVEKYQTTSHAPEALERMVECYLALGVPDEARKAAAVLGRNYPNTYWYRQSLRLMLKHYPGATPVRAEAPAQPAPTGQ